jgi:uncharacterized membrane protein (DUF485 family)
MSALDPESHLPPHHNPLAALDQAERGGHRITTAEEFVAAQSSPEFTELRRKFRTFAFPWTVAFLVWYFAYVLLSTYAEEFMSIPVIGYVNIGLLLGLAQFATTFLLTWLYVRHANRNLDPLASKMRAELEGDA